MSTEPSITVRPISFAEIEAAGQANEPIHLHVLGPHPSRTGVAATPYVLTPRPRLHKGLEEHVPVFAQTEHPTRPGEYKVDNGDIVGHRVRFEGRSIFGTTTDVNLTTTQEAANVVLELDGTPHPSKISRDRVLIEDPDGTVVPLMPVYGAEATVNILVRGAEPQDVHDRVVRALSEEFGPDSEIAKILTRPVIDRRVDVYKDGELAAVNILASQAHHHVDLPFETRTSNPNLVMGR